jgi:hypothetical protein
MIGFAMPDEGEKPTTQTPDQDETPRPVPADNSPFGSAPKTPAKPEYDERSLWPGDLEQKKR